MAPPTVRARSRMFIPKFQVLLFPLPTAFDILCVGVYRLTESHSALHLLLK